MATCPNCGSKIPFWNIKAECKKCGVSIPNFNWVERLEEDNKNAEAAFTVFYRTMNRVRYSLFGTKLRIVRFVLTFLPAVAFIIPWASVNSAGSSFQLTLFSFTGARSALDIFLQIFSNFSLILDNLKFENFFGPTTFLVVGTIFYFLSALFIVIAFFMNIIKCKKPKTKSAITFDIITIIFSVISVVLFSLSSSVGADAGAFAVGEFGAYDVYGGFFWGYIIALVLFLVALGINIAVVVAPAKSDETLEEERLAKAAAKAAKEHEEELRKAQEREEAAKAHAEEQKRIVEEAKRKVAEKKAKDEAKRKKKN